MSQSSVDNRRQFIARAGKVALATPPVMALLLKAEGRNYAMAASGMSSTRVDRLEQREQNVEAVALDAHNRGLNNLSNRLDQRADRIQAKIDRLDGK